MRYREVKLYYGDLLCLSFYVFPRHIVNPDLQGLRPKDLSVEVIDEEGEAVVKNDSAAAILTGGRIDTDVLFEYGRITL